MLPNFGKFTLLVLFHIPEASVLGFANLMPRHLLGALITCSLSVDIFSMLVVAGLRSISHTTGLGCVSVTKHSLMCSGDPQHHSEKGKLFGVSCSS
jgi:hypothetical protein